jgi:4-amino-4-deoxy-L-arabinose transferase-like glycosyltransferase
MQRIHFLDQRINSFSQKKWSAILFGIAFVLALLFAFILFPSLLEVSSGLDPDGYGKAGQGFYETGQFQSIEIAPLYPAFIAVVSWLSGGYQVKTVQFAQCLVFALTCLVLYAIFQRTLSPQKAKYAGLLCAMYPMSIWYVPRLWTEILLALMIALATLALIRLLQKPTSFNTLICGLTVGLAALSKGIALVFVPLFILVLLIRFRTKGILSALLFTAGASAFILPWTWRNWQQTGRFLPTHTGGGYNFYLGNGFVKHWFESPLSYQELKRFAELDMQAWYDRIGFAPEDPLTVDSVLMQAALAELQAKPYLIFQKMLIQSITFWYLAATASKSLFTGILQLPILLLAVPGMLRSLRFRSWALCLFIPVMGIWSTAALIFSFGRLSATIMPYIIGLLVYGLFPQTNTPADNSQPLSAY